MKATVKDEKVNITVTQFLTSTNALAYSMTRWLDKNICPIFGKSSQNSCQDKNAKIFTSKLNLKVQIFCINQLLKPKNTYNRLFSCLYRWKSRNSALVKSSPIGKKKPNWRKVAQSGYLSWRLHKLKLYDIGLGHLTRFASRWL